MKSRLDAVLLGMNEFLAHANPNWPSSQALRIGCVCKAGLHRSVSGARVLSYILAREGYAVKDVQHMAVSKMAKRKLCGYHKDFCAECSEAPRCRAKEGTLRQAWERWQEL